MISGLADTNILIELYRNVAGARVWFATQSDLAISTVTWLEFIEGARGKNGQKRCAEIMAQFELVFLTDADQQWAMAQLLKYRLSRGVSFQDCLIASVCHRLQVPIYTQNVKDFLAVLPAQLVIQPY
jgi:predicted nucleic acid-binding protein